MQISCGEAHTLCLTDEGHIYSFGASSCGQLGLDNLEGKEQQRKRQFDGRSYTFNTRPRMVMNLVSKKVIQIQCGGVHNIAIVESPPYLLAKELYSAYLK